jgi:Helix-turn-helix domain
MKGQRRKKLDSSTGTVPDRSTYLSPKDLADRWRCSQPTVARIAERAGLRRFCLGEGRNGMVRYLRTEVEAYEASRCVRSDS